MVLRRSTAKFADLKRKLDESNNKQQNLKKDERIIIIGKDEKKKTSNLLFKLLADENGDSIVSFHTHNVFKQSGGFSDICPTTKGEECPICDWNKSKNKEEVLSLYSSYRKEKYIFLIYVVADKNKPVNDGKVFFLEVGKSVYKQLLTELEDIDDDKNIIDYIFNLKFSPDANGGKYSLRVTEDICKRQYEIDDKFVLQNYIDNLPVKSYDVLAAKWDKFTEKEF